MEISPARREILCHKSLRLLTSSSPFRAPVLFLSLLSHREYCAAGDRMANLTVKRICSCFVKVNIETLLGDSLKITFSLEVSFLCLFP